jgi:hypothetical protein
MFCNPGEFPTISAASMWTRKDIKEFKDSIRKEGGDAIIKVGHGETVTVSFIFHNALELFAQSFINPHLKPISNLLWTL